METKKHHYRNVFKSDHLGSADLEELIENGQRLVFTIKNVRQEMGVKVAGKKGDHNVAYFVEPIKPMILNATNSKTMRQFTGSAFVEDWNNVPVELYIDDNVKAVTGGTTQGVRISQVQPIIGQPEKPQFTSANFEKALAANATVEQIEQRYTLHESVKAEYLKLLEAKQNEAANA